MSKRMAVVDENGLVSNLIVVPDYQAETDFILDCGGKFVNIGFTYDENLDGFIPPQPYPSWVLDEETCLWVAPIPMPEGVHTWDEGTQSWDAVSEA